MFETIETFQCYYIFKQYLLFVKQLFYFFINFFTDLTSILINFFLLVNISKLDKSCLIKINF